MVMDKAIIIIGIVILSVLLIGSPSLSGDKEGGPAVIPKPASIESLSGEVELPDGARLALPSGVDGGWERTARLFAAKARDRFGARIEVVVAGGRREACDGVVLVGELIDACGLGRELPGKEFGPEDYAILADGKVLVRAGSSHGFQHALMTLLQLIDENSDPPAVPAALIADGPRFAWRGFMLDSSRAFQPPDVIMRYLDLMAEIKLNVFHWHLTDDQGWRIESKTCPLLHEVGGILDTLEPLQKRALDKHGWGRDGRGYYTQDEIAEIVEYAARRHIMVVPEIDMPGHASAMLAAYPELSCNGRGAPVRRGRGIWPTALCPGKEEVYDFIDVLVGEVAPLFPAPYFHVGGDEVAAADWLDYPGNRELMEERGLRDRAELQGYFMERVGDLLAQHGKTMIAWDETAGNLPENGVVQVWRQHDLARTSAEAGHNVIVSQFGHYLNYSPFVHTMKAVYQFDPVPTGLDHELHSSVIGGEACLWGHEITLANMDGKLFPRLLAEAEILWSPAESKDWRDFTRRVDAAGPVYKERGVRFGRTWRSTRRP